jgi:MFS family permease
MGLLGTQAGRVARRYGSKLALIVGTGVTAVSFGFLWAAHAHPFEMLISAALLGIGIGLAFAALGNLIVQAVPATQTGIATGMNTVMRTLGGALGGQISATFIADNVANGQPTVTGFNLTFAMATGFLIVCMLTSFLVPGTQAAAKARDREEEHLERQEKELVREAAVS